MMRIGRLACIALLALVAGVGFAQPVAVVWADAVAGDDRADGLTAPTRTLARSLETARHLHGQGQPVIVRLRAGTYRETLTWRSANESAVTFEGEAGAVVSGADVWETWREDGRLLVADWPYRWGASPIPQGWIINGFEGRVPEIVRRRELVVQGGRRLRQVLGAGGLSQPGTFRVDESRGIIEMHPWPEGGVIEVGVRAMALDVQNSVNVTVRGITFTQTVNHFDGSGNMVNNVTGLLLEDNRFVANGSGGLGLLRSRGTSRRNVYDDNGATGWGGGYNHALLSEDDQACGNNWRGAQGDFRGWSVAGVKHLHLRGVEYRNLTVCDNEAAGLWLDTDVEVALIAGLVARNNAEAGLYLENSQGPVTVRGAVIEGNAKKGVYASSLHRWTLAESVIRDNGEAGIWIGGALPDRRAWNHETDQDMRLYPARQFVWVDNQVAGRSEAAPALAYMTGLFEEQFKPTFTSGRNRWWNADGTRPFRVGNNFPARYGLEGWRARSGQDADSVMGPPAVAILPTATTVNATPSATPQPVTATPSATATVVLSPTVEVTETPTPEATSTGGMRLVLVVEMRVWVDGGGGE